LNSKLPVAAHPAYQNCGENCAFSFYFSPQGVYMPRKARTVEQVSAMAVLVVAAYIAGKFSPRGKRMGHAGAIIRGSAGTVEEKVKSLSAAGVTTLPTPIHVLDWAVKHNLQ